jgi:hypothetical protein
LEGGVLAIVAEYQQALWVQIVEHVLGEHMNIRNRSRPDRPGRLTKAGTNASAICVTAKAATEKAFIIRLCLDGAKAYHFVRMAAMATALSFLFVQGATMAAKPNIYHSSNREILAGNKTVNKHATLTIFGRAEWFPITGVSRGLTATKRI